MNNDFIPAQVPSRVTRPSSRPEVTKQSSFKDSLDIAASLANDSYLLRMKLQQAVHDLTGYVDPEDCRAVSPAEPNDPQGYLAVLVGHLLQTKREQDRTDNLLQILAARLA